MAYEASSQLERAGVAHCHIEGDNLCAALPPPDAASVAEITETNLAAMWRTYAAAGYRRLIYVNTISVTESALITRALTAAVPGSSVEIAGVLLTATDETSRERLGRREIGGALEWHLTRSADRAAWLDEHTPDWVRRVTTDGRPVAQIAAEVIHSTGWLASAG